MDTIERISAWIQEQKKKGRTHEDLEGTIFILANDKAARISLADDVELFDVEILLSPYAVDFTRPEDIDGLED